MSQLPLQVLRLAPDLKRPAVVQNATDTLASIACLPIVPPEDVGWAHEPVFMRKIDSDGAGAETEQARPSDEGDVVEHDHVIRPCCEHFANRPAMDHRPPELMSEEG